MKEIFKIILKIFLPYFSRYLRFTKSNKNIPINYFTFIKHHIFHISNTYWYKHKNCTVANPRKIYVGVGCLIGNSGCYIQGAGTIHIGNYVRIARNVGILSSNHDLYDQNKYNNEPIKIGDYSWIGMNSVITAGVELGPRTIVGAGSVVTKSFPEGYCVIAGTPAKVVKYLDKDKFVPWHYEEEWYGYLTKEEFEKNRKKYIDI